jgi:RNA polymerase sigma-70 factor (ECF subfamily)
MVEESDQTLVRRCREGDRDAFGLLVDKYQKAIFNAALRIVRVREDAEDVTQNAFLKAYAKLDSFDDRYRFFSWLYRIAMNEAINLASRRRRHDELPDTVSAGSRTAHEELVRREMSHQVASAILQLHPEDRALISLKHFEQFTYKDISFILEISEKKVKSRLYTARQRLRDVMLTMKIIRHD